MRLNIASSGPKITLGRRIVASVKPATIASSASTLERMYLLVELRWSAPIPDMCTRRCTPAAFAASAIALAPSTWTLR